MLSNIKILEKNGRKCVGYFDFHRIVDNLQYEIDELMDEYEIADLKCKEAYVERRRKYKKLQEARYRTGHIKLTAGEISNNKKHCALVFIDGSNKEELVRLLECITEAEAFMNKCKKSQIWV